MQSRNARLPDLAGKTAIVTGAAWGIGHATTLALIAEGAQVVATDLEEEREGLDELVALGDGAVTPYVADVASEEDWRRVVETAGVVDVLVNNAGGYRPPNFPDTSTDRWGAVLDVKRYGASFRSRRLRD